MMYLGRKCESEHLATSTDGRAVRELLTFSDLTKAGEKLAVEFSYCENHGGKHALPVLWARKGWKDHVLNTWWSVDVYAREDGGAGTCWGRYNQTEREDPAGALGAYFFCSGGPPRMVSGKTEAGKILILLSGEY